MRKHVCLLLPAAIIALTGIISSSHAALPVGTMAPDFSLTTTTGTQVKLSQFRGKIVILHFWKSN